MGTRKTAGTCAGLTVMLCSLAAARTVAASTIVVTSTSEFDPGSLRSAIASATPGDTIEMRVRGTIGLTGTPIVIRKNLSIVGPGAANLAILGNGTSRVLTIDTATVSISGVTIGSGFADYGGAVLNSGTLTLTDCVLSSNSATMFGGAIFNSGTLNLVRSIAANNFAEYRGGAIYTDTDSTLTVDHSTLSGNSSSIGGAIDNQDGTLAIVASTLSRNFTTGTSGGAGGALFNGGLGGRVTIVGSTFASNVAAWEGGAIYTLSGTTTIANSTIANNTSTCDFGGCSGGGGIYALSAALSIDSSTLSNNTSLLGGNVTSLYTVTTVRNSILARGRSGPNCYMYFGTEFASGGNNVSDDLSCAALFTEPGDVNGVAAELSPRGLQDHGGPTETIAPLASSPAVDRVPLQACTIDGAPMTVDQRGMPRPSGDACDTGAFELRLEPTMLVLSGPTPSSIIAGSNGPLIFAATLSGGATTAIANAVVGWSIDGADLSAFTVTNIAGVATLSYDPSSLGVGSHTVRATFARQTVGDTAFDGSATNAMPFEVTPSPYTAIVQPPIASDGTTVFKTNRGVVPVKFSLAYDGARTCEMRTATIALFQTAGTTVGPVTLDVYSLPADSGAAFRFDATACQYVYNISTVSLPPGTYRVTMQIENIRVGAAMFGIQ
jgi:predicted outer membrane repeat protein